MKKHIIYFLLFVFPVLFSCGTKGNSEKEEEHEHAHETEGAHTATLSEAQMESIGIAFGSIEQKQLTASLKANGILKVPNQNRASITSLYGGVIKTILVQPGNTVQKGQAIATIVNPEFIMLQEEYLSLEAEVKYAKLEYERQKELSGNNAGAVKNFQQSESDLNTLEARKASVQKQLELIGISTEKLGHENMVSSVSITSPVSGAVSKVSVNIGSYVDINTSIAEVVDNSQLHLDLYIYEKDLPKIKVGQTIHFTLTNNPGQEYDAEIYGISNTFEDNTKAIAAHAIVKGDKTGLIDGMSITALVSLENATVTAIPADAIVNYQGEDYIFIVSDAHNEEEHHAEEETHHAEEEETVFERVPVRKGTTDIGYSEITLLEEIPADAKVVVKGAFFILAKMTNEGEGHTH